MSSSELSRRLQVLEVDAGFAELAQQRGDAGALALRVVGVDRARCRRRTARGRSRRARRERASSGCCSCSVELLLAELAHQLGLLLDQDDLALADHADAVGHLLGLLDVVGGQDDGDAASRAARAPSPTCRAAARRRRRRSARRGTGCRGSCDSALAISTRRFMPPESVMILLSFLSHSDSVAQHLLDVRRVRRLAEQAAAEATRRPRPSRTRRS